MAINCVNTENPLLQLVSTNTSAVFTCNTAIPYDDTIPQQTEGNEVVTATITPRYVDSILEITFFASVTKDANAGTIQVALFQDAGLNAIAASANTVAANRSVDVGISYTMASGTTSSTTFKIRIGPGANNCYLNGDNVGNRLMGGVANAILIIKEFA